MREIVLDTETTGFDPFTGDRIVEIGALELEDQLRAVLARSLFADQLRHQQRVWSQPLGRQPSSQNAFYI